MAQQATADPVVTSDVDISTCGKKMSDTLDGLEKVDKTYFTDKITMDLYQQVPLIFKLMQACLPTRVTKE